MCKVSFKHISWQVWNLMGETTSKNLLSAKTLVDSQLRTGTGHGTGTFRRHGVTCGDGKGTWQGGWEVKRQRLSFNIAIFSSEPGPPWTYPKTKNSGAENHAFQLPELNINGGQLPTKFDSRAQERLLWSPHPQSQLLPGRGLTLHHLIPLKTVLSLGRVATYTSVRNLN